MMHVLAPHGLPQSGGLIIKICNALIEGALYGRKSVSEQRRCQKKFTLATGIRWAE